MTHFDSSSWPQYIRHWLSGHSFIMSARIKKCFPKLKKLRDSSAQSRNFIIQSADRQLLKSICEIVLNVLKGNVKLDDKQRKQLKLHRDLLRKLVDKKVNLPKKRKILLQRGGFLPSLLIPALAVAASIIGNV